MSESKGWTLTVTDLNTYVDRSLKADPILRSVRLCGEISGFKANASGHWYFALKDEQSRIDCVMFRQSAYRMSYKPVDGDQVLLHGYVTVYAAGGRYQFVADSMRPQGIGSLYQQFERLKMKLEAEGLFDAERKRPLPPRPRKIVVVTSETGAVWHDICRVAARRDPGVPITLIPAAVQGIEAADDIVRAIERVKLIPDADVLIVGRGGGSMEDLWCFNEERVARAIASCPIPVISAVGHETDFTIADFVADVRASTPSNASEIAVPDRSEMKEAFRIMRRRFEASAREAQQRMGNRLLHMQKRLVMVQPDHQLQQMRERINLGRAELDRLMDHQLQQYPARLIGYRHKLQGAMDRATDNAEARLKRDQVHLEAVSPQRVLERGYTYVTGPDGAVTSAQSAPEKMQIHFRDGKVNVHRE